MLPVPYEATVSYGRGTARGPAAIVAASVQVELYDEEFGCEPAHVGIATMPALDVNGLKPAVMAKRVREAVLKIVHDGKLPLLLGGEHSITPPSVAAITESYGKITVLQLDAHADLRGEYEGESMNHACAMARVREICPVVHVGIRNISVEEAQLVRNEGLPIFYARDILCSERWVSEVLDVIEDESVYVTIDVDFFDPSSMPATGTPEPGGLDWYHATRLLRALAECKKIVGFDLVELAPIAGIHACDFLAAKLAYKCVGYWWEGGRKKEAEKQEAKKQG